MHYTFNQLRIYRAVVENQSVTKAAEELHMTQPAVSVQLRNLQDQFAIPLTEVIGRQLYITEFGRELYQMAGIIMQQVDTINYRAQSFEGLLSGKLKISVASTGKYVMPYYLKDFLKAHPAIDLNMDVTNKSKVIESLEKNEVDFSLVSVMPRGLDLQQEVLLPNKLYLAGAVDSDIKTTRKANKSVFDQLPLIFREEGSGTRVLMQQYFQKAGIVPKVRMELTSNEAVKQAVMAGLGYSIQSILSMKNELKNSEIRIIPVKELPLVENWRLVWRSAKKTSVVATAFLEHIRQNKQRIYATHFSWIERY
jgi:DNA-binding transcriptional LysR family regulator